ncbi:MAG TPA: NAD(P)-dependent oxidoreductase [Candidatus Limnocylindrales bacterium]|nr:NAD(P)-dependent oxidoreductase [Candidatus Limnocylindrales bacterium]
MSVLVTGAAGFFGSAIVRALCIAGHDVVALDRTPQRLAQTRPDTPGDRVRYLVGDVTNAADLEPVRFGGVTAIVHAAALSLPDEVTSASTILDVNVRGTLNVLSLAAALPSCDRFLLVSSAGVYDLATPGRIQEADATGGRSLYGATKLAAEILAIRAGEVLGFGVGVVRPSSLWGPGEVDRPTRPFVTPLQRLVECARAGDPVEPRGLDAAWDWTYVDDAAEGLVRFLATEMGGRRITLASGARIRFRDVVAAVTDVFGLRVASGATVVDGSPDRPGELTVDALAEATGWRPSTTLVEGLRRYRRFLEDPTSTAGQDGEPGPTTTPAPR